MILTLVQIEFFPLHVISYINIKLTLDICYGPVIGRLGKDREILQLKSLNGRRI